MSNKELPRGSMAALQAIKRIIRHPDWSDIRKAEEAYRAALDAQPDAPEPDWPDVSPAGLRKMAEIAAPNNGAVFRAAADEIERLSARAEPSTPPAGERANKLSRRWMAMIDYAYQCRDDIRSSSGHTPRSSELRLLEEEMRAALAAQPEPAAQDKEDAERWREWLKGASLTVVVPTPTDKNPASKTTIIYGPSPYPSFAAAMNAAVDAARAATKTQGGA